MKKTEAQILLQRYAPGTIAPKTKVADFVLDLVAKNGHTFGMDNQTGDWVILGAGGSVLARCT